MAKQAYDFDMSVARSTEQEVQAYRDYQRRVKELDQTYQSCVNKARLARKKQIEEERVKIRAERARINQANNDRIKKENELKRLEAARQRREAARQRAEEARRRYEEELRRRREIAEQNAKDYNTRNRTNISNTYVSSVKQGTEIARNTVDEVSDITSDFYQGKTGYTSDKINGIFNQDIGNESKQKQDEFEKLDELSDEDLSTLMAEIKQLQAELDSLNKTNEKIEQEAKNELVKMKQEEETFQLALKEMDERDRELEQQLKEFEENNK
ncbi:hypothetical protein [Bacteroides sp. 224]|uniref:hypothetical protein n=1 Tax=Bacteroides sp. 224 TaxID=2302936 RepID=UPI0013D2C7E8|nr:hypothetical protein [Bacteroides sp. 224]